ncbi:MAG: glycosyltransferase family 2 protein [Acidobacteriota bacterium]|nr:glycosyltransferase family 2 protein [Acidobacteriota bacterium]
MMPASARTSIAVLLTCYNRKDTTLAALQRLYAQHGAGQFTVFLVDDNSPDGTASAVTAEFPQVRLLHGNGNLFWCGGMRMAFAAALAEDFDFYLWLNDDTMLADGAVSRLLDAYEKVRAGSGDAAILVGSTSDPQTNKITYGGYVRAGRIHPFHYRLVEPGSEPKPCLTMNGNCVLIPRAVARKVENLSAEFHHSIGDIDYGLRARAAGCQVWVAPGVAGACRHNDVRGSFIDQELTLGRRWHHLLSTKGLPPREHLVFCRRHGGWLWPVFWVLPYVRIILSSLTGR